MSGSRTSIVSPGSPSPVTTPPSVESTFGGFVTVISIGADSFPSGSICTTSRSPPPSIGPHSNVPSGFTTVEQSTSPVSGSRTSIVSPGSPSPVITPPSVESTTGGFVTVISIGADSFPSGSICTTSRSPPPSIGPHSNVPSGFTTVEQSTSPVSGSRTSIVSPGSPSPVTTPPSVESTTGGFVTVISIGADSFPSGSICTTSRSPPPSIGPHSKVPSGFTVVEHRTSPVSGSRTSIVSPGSPSPVTTPPSVESTFGGFVTVISIGADSFPSGSICTTSRSPPPSIGPHSNVPSGFTTVEQSTSPVSGSRTSIVSPGSPSPVITPPSVESTTGCFVTVISIGADSFPSGSICTTSRSPPPSIGPHSNVPSGFTTVEQSTSPVSGSRTSIVSPGSPSPVITPPSVESTTGGFVTVIGVVGDSLPPGSIATTSWLPGGRGASGVPQVNAPVVASAVVSHKTSPVSGSRMTTVEPGSAVPVTTPPSVESTVGARGAVSSTSCALTVSVASAPSTVNESSAVVA